MPWVAVEPLAPWVAELTEDERAELQQAQDSLDVLMRLVESSAPPLSAAFDVVANLLMATVCRVVKLEHDLAARSQPGAETTE
jgi:hypothetical protein